MLALLKNSGIIRDLMDKITVYLDFVDWEPIGQVVRE